MLQEIFFFRYLQKPKENNQFLLPFFFFFLTIMVVIRSEDISKLLMFNYNWPYQRTNMRVHWRHCNSLLKSKDKRPRKKKKKKAISCNCLTFLLKSFFFFYLYLYSFGLYVKTQIFGYAQVSCYSHQQGMVFRILNKVQTRKYLIKKKGSFKHKVIFNLFLFYKGVFTQSCVYLIIMVQEYYNTNSFFFLEGLLTRVTQLVPLRGLLQCSGHRWTGIFLDILAKKKKKTPRLKKNFNGSHGCTILILECLSKSSLLGLLLLLLSYYR